MGNVKSVETQNRIFTSAKILFYEQGYENTTVRQITKNAGMKNQASFYQYFTDKIDIVQAIATDYIKNVMSFDALNIEENDPLVHFFIVQKIILSHIMLDRNNGNFYSEFEKHSTYEYFENNTGYQYKQLFLDLNNKYNPKISQHEYAFFIMAYNATMGKAIININKNNIMFDKEDAMISMTFFYPKLLGIDSVELYDKYSLAEIAFKNLPQKIIKEIKLLI